MLGYKVGTMKQKASAMHCMLHTLKSILPNTDNNVTAHPDIVLYNLLFVNKIDIFEKLYFYFWKLF